MASIPQFDDGSRDDESSSDDEYYQSRARPISYYLNKSTSSISNPQSSTTSDHNCGIPDEERNENECEQEESYFDDSRNSIPERPSYSEGTLNVALQDHEEVDYDEKINMTNEDGTCKDTSALANQKTICIAPSRIAKERWPDSNKESFNDKIRDALNSFRNSKYTNKTYKKRSINLVITDSMMSSINFEEIYQNTIKLFVGYPNDPFEVIKQIKKHIENNENDYIIKNILLCIGFDSAVYYPNINQATKDTNKFLNHFLNVIKKAFAQNGPKRFKKIFRKLEELTEEIKEELMPIQPPRVIIVTIPGINSHPTAFTYNLEIEKTNKAITKYVASAKDFAFKKHNIVLELYDWAKFASTYHQCNTNDLHERNRILTVDLAEQYTWLMTPRSTENPTALQQDQAEAQDRRKLIENESVVPKKNNSKKSKSLTFASPIHQMDSDEDISLDVEMEDPQVDESQNSQDSIIDEENNSIARKLRKRKSSSNNIHPLEKKPNSQRRGDSSSDSFESDDDEVSKGIDSSLSILDPTKYEVRRYDGRNILIFVFSSKDKSTCYEFSKVATYYYRCNGCHEKKKLVTIELRKNESTDKNSVFMKDDLQHCCTPREYNPERLSKKPILPSNFIFFKEKNVLRAVIYDDQKRFCYKYWYTPSKNNFFCYECSLIQKKKSVTLKLNKNDEGQEYFTSGKIDHVCEPLNYGKVIKGMELLSSSGLNFDKNTERPKPDPRYFKIEENKNGNRKLIIYTSSEKLQWYKYVKHYNDKFRCTGCSSLGKHVIAKYSKNGYVHMEKQHICTPFTS